MIELAREKFNLSAPVLAILLIGLTLAVYWPVQNYSFLGYDDPVYVTKNVMVQQGLSRESISWAFSASEAGFWHPLTWISLMMDYEIYGLNPSGYHWSNLLLHLAGTLLLFRVIYAMTGASGRSMVVAALFALHPLHVESVAWIAERKDVLSALFWMATMNAYVFYVRKPGYGRYILVLLCFLMGLMAKPMLVTLPVIMLLLDYWPLRRFWDSTVGPAEVKGEARLMIGRRRRLIFIEKIPLLFIALACSVITYRTVSGFQALASPGALPLQDRLSTAVIAAVTYLWKTLWPVELAAFYPHPGSWPFSWTAGAAIFLISVTFYILSLYRSRPWLVVGWSWYLIALLPVSGIIQVGSHAMADRYTYIPLIGVFIMAVWSFPEKTPWKGVPGRPLAIFVVIMLFILLSWRSSMQLRVWQNDETLFRHALKVTEGNYLAHSGLGAYLAHHGNDDEALRHLYRSVTIRPDYAPAWFKMGVIYSRQGLYREAADSLRQILKDSPAHTDARRHLAWNLLMAGELDEAIRHFRELLRYGPGDGELYNNLGVALMKKGALPPAADAFRKALSLHPDHAGYHFNLATVLLASGEENEARRHLQRALYLQPDFLAAHERLAFLLRRAGALKEAVDHETAARMIRLDNKKP